LSFSILFLRFCELCASAGIADIRSAHISTGFVFRIRSSREADRRIYIPSRLIKVLVPDKDEYAILADVLREEREKNSRDSSMDDEDLQSRTSKETYRSQRTRTVDRDDKKLFLYHASAEEKRVGD
jgi:hypothetical protein